LALSLQGKNTEAISALNLATKKNPELAIAYFVRASIYIDLGDRASALTNYQKAARLYQKQGNQSGYKNTMEAIAEFKLIP
jgi:tetratricopeptide (TPR) repeat protein